jgi:PAS domain S-box-containing protein
LSHKRGVYLACNTTFERFFGAKEQDIVGKTDYDFVSPEQADFFRAHDRKAMEFNASCSNEEWVTFADDGHRALLYTTKTPMYETNGTLIGVLGIGRDITALKSAENEKNKLEGQLLQAQKMEAIGRLAGGVAHDFNNMLVVIIGNTEMALEGLDRSNPLYEDLSEIRVAAKRSAELTRQLLAFARKQTMAPKVLDLNDTISGMLKMLQRLIGENIQIIWKPKTGIWPVKLDPSQVDQLLANLCVNSRDAIAGIGSIRIETGNKTLDPEYCLLHKEFLPGDYVIISISDSGHGMDRDTLDHIFEPFFTTKTVGAGTGLGLATVYGIVKQNNSHITVSSEPGAGTIFTIYVPKFNGPREHADTGSAIPATTRGHEVILLDEDEPAIRKGRFSKASTLSKNPLTHRIWLPPSEPL